MLMTLIGVVTFGRVACFGGQMLNSILKFMMIVRHQLICSVCRDLCLDFD